MESECIYLKNFYWFEIFFLNTFIDEGKNAEFWDLPALQRTFY